MHVAPHVTKLQQEIILPDTNAVGTMSKFVAVPGNAVATVRSLQHTTPGNAVAKAVVKVVCNTSI